MNMGQPFQDIGVILSSKELLDYMYSNAKKEASRVPEKIPREMRIKRKEETRIRVAGKMATEKLQKILEEVPKVDDIPPFYKELADILLGIPSLKKNLAALNWAAKTINAMAGFYSRIARYAEDFDEAANARKAAYGRISSIVRQISGNLDYLKDARDKLARLPTFEMNVTTLVVAGYANVGKSSFVRQISSAKPEIASYPFTTKEIMVGHGKFGKTFYQVVDTPGLLDRPLKDRNKIELQAILALKHLANCIIFVVDPTETCGYTLEKQLNLYREVEEMFPEIPKIVALNKMDFAEGSQKEEAEKLFAGAIPVSALRNEGTKEVLEATLLKIQASS